MCAGVKIKMKLSALFLDASTHLWLTLPNRWNVNSLRDSRYSMNGISTHSLTHVTLWMERQLTPWLTLPYGWNAHSLPDTRYPMDGTSTHFHSRLLPFVRNVNSLIDSCFLLDGTPNHIMTINSHVYVVRKKIIRFIPCGTDFIFKQTQTKMQCYIQIGI